MRERGGRGVYAHENIYIEAASGVLLLPPLPPLFVAVLLSLSLSFPPPQPLGESRRPPSVPLSPRQTTPASHPQTHQLTLFQSYRTSPPFLSFLHRFRLCLALYGPLAPVSYRRISRSYLRSSLCRRQTESGEAQTSSQTTNFGGGRQKDGERARGPPSNFVRACDSNAAVPCTFDSNNSSVFLGYRCWGGRRKQGDVVTAIGVEVGNALESREELGDHSVQVFWARKAMGEDINYKRFAEAMNEYWHGLCVTPYRLVCFCPSQRPEEGREIRFASRVRACIVVRR